MSETSMPPLPPPKPALDPHARAFDDDLGVPMFHARGVRLVGGHWKAVAGIYRERSGLNDWLNHNEFPHNERRKAR